ncbi:MAG: hypothetical protein JW776_09360 [Candidatus Lokiarchaeota archaeon]|nr:hypothetical protein [Candidatus Lokiarchaeota archaeon]
MRNKKTKLFITIFFFILFYSCIGSINARLFNMTTNVIEPEDVFILYKNELGLGNTGQIDIDSLGNVHGVYINDSGDFEEIVYITNSTGIWTKQLVNDYGYGHWWTDIEIDSHNNIHLLAQEDCCGIKYLKINATGEWNTLTQIGNGGYPKIVTDTQNISHIVYGLIPGTEIIYINTSLNAQPVSISDPTIETHSFPDLAIDADGDVHIVFEGTSMADSSIREIYYCKYSTQTGILSSITDISNYGLSASTPTIEVDSTGTVHVAFVCQNVSTEYLKLWYLSFDGDIGPSSVTPAKINSDDVPCTFPHIELDSNDKAHIVYEASYPVDFRISETATSPPEINYVTNKGGSWRDTRVTRELIHLEFTGISISPITDSPIICYSDREDNEEGAKYHFNLLEMKNGYFGDLFSISAQFSDEDLQVDEEVEYQFQVTIGNPLTYQQHYDLTISLSDVDTINLVTGDRTRNLADLAGLENITYIWGISTEYSGSKSVNAILTSDGEYVCQIGFGIVVASGLEIGGFHTFALLAIGVITIIFVIRKKLWTKAQAN